MLNESNRITIGVGCGALTVLAAALVLVPQPQAAAAQMSALHRPLVPEAVSYEAEIQPFFDKNCVSCHGGEDDGEKRLEAGLNLMSYEGVAAGSEFGTVIEAGDAAGSILLEMVESGEMPEEGDPATPEEIELLRTWITEGAENN
jgi:mono/diheme cytochrome c family protein